MAKINTAQLAKMIIILFEHTQNVDSRFQNLKNKYSNKICFLNPNKILNKARKINELALRQPQNIDKNSAYLGLSRGQIKVFNWTVAAYCCIYKIRLEELEEKHILDLQKVFQSKPESLIKFHVLMLINDRISNENFQAWSNEQRKFLTEIAKQKKKRSLSWQQVSYEIYRESDGKIYYHFTDCKRQWHSQLGISIPKATDKMKKEDGIKPKLGQGKWKDISQQSKIQKSAFGFKEAEFFNRNKLNTAKNSFEIKISLFKSAFENRIVHQRKESNDSYQSENQYFSGGKKEKKNELFTIIQEEDEMNQFEDQIYSSQQIANDNKHNEKCWTQMLRRSVVMQELIRDNHLSGADELTEIAFLSLFQEHVLCQYQAIPWDLCQQVNYSFQDEWLTISQESLTREEEDYFCIFDHLE